MIAVEVALFAAAMLGIWWIRHQQLRSLAQQRAFLQRFAEGVAVWRGKAGIPNDARQAIETLVTMTMGKAAVRRLAILVLPRQKALKLDENPLWLARQQLTDEQREAFDWLFINFFFAFTYGDWLSGPIIRHVRFGGLSLQTQAEVALETVSSRGMGEAVHASA